MCGEVALKILEFVDTDLSFRFVSNVHQHEFIVNLNNFAADDFTFLDTLQAFFEHLHEGTFILGFRLGLAGIKRQFLCNTILVFPNGGICVFGF